MANTALVRFDTERLSTKVTQAGHTFVAGNVVRYNTISEEWELALADSESTLGQAVVVKVSGDTFEAAFAGKYTLSSAHGLTLGSQYYLSDSVAGSLTTAAPTIVQKILIPITTTDVLVKLEGLSGSGGGASDFSELTGSLANSQVPAGELSLDKLDTTGIPTSASFLRGDGQWTDVSVGTILNPYEVVLSSEQSTINITGVDLAAAKSYVLEMELLASTTLATDIQVRFNNDAADTDYICRFNYFGGAVNVPGTPSSIFIQPCSKICQTDLSNGYYYLRGTLQKIDYSGGTKTGLVGTYLRHSPGVELQTGDISLEKYGTSIENITSLQVISTTGSFLAGSKVRIREYFAEGTGGGGTISGTIAANEVAFGTGVDSIGGDSRLTYNTSTNVLNLESPVGDTALTITDTASVFTTELQSGSIATISNNIEKASLSSVDVSLTLKHDTLGPNIPAIIALDETDSSAPLNLSIKELQINTDAGLSGQVLTSAGSGLPPTWEDPIGGTGTGSSLTKEITQASHGLSVGDVVRLSGTAYVKAQADSSTNAEVAGIVSTVSSLGAFTLTISGEITGLTGLTAGEAYFLSADTPGELTVNAPSTVGDIIKPLLIATSSTSGYFYNMRGEIVSDTTTIDFTDLTGTINGSTQINDDSIPVSKLQGTGDPDGIATLDGAGKVPSTQLPSYVDDVLEYPDLASFPPVGTTGIIYVALDSHLVYRWSGSAYVEISSGGISGTIAANEIAFGTGTGSIGGSSNLTYDTSKVTITGSGSILELASDIDGVFFEADTNFYTVSLIDPLGSGARLDLSGVNGVIASGSEVKLAKAEAPSTNRLLSFGDDGTGKTALKADITTDGGATFNADDLRISADAIVLNGDSGTAGQVLTSAGPGAPATWEDAGGGATPSDATPQSIGTAAPGVSNDYSRADHVHDGSLSDLDDVSSTAPTLGQVLAWGGGEWSPSSLAAYDQMLYVSDGADASLANGSPVYPFASISAALASITDATPTKRYTILITAGEYTEAGTVNLKPNVFLCGIVPDAVRITATTWALDAAFTGSADNRTGIHNCIVNGAVNLNFTTVTSAAGKFYARNTIFNGAVTLTGYNNAIVQAQFSACQFYALVSVQGVNVGVANDNIHFNGLTLTQSPYGGVPTIWAATGGQMSGTLTATTTVNDFNRRISLFCKSFWMGTVVIDGPSTYLDYTVDCLPVAGATVLNGANLVLINPATSEGANTSLSNLAFPTAVNNPIIPASTNATNMGDWNKQWMFNFGYVHLSSATDLYLASAGASAVADSAGRSIYIEADTYGLATDVNGGDINITTQAGVTGTGVRGKIALNANYVEINGAYKLPSADGTANQVLKTDGAGQTTWQDINALPITHSKYIIATPGDDLAAKYALAAALTVTATDRAALILMPGTYTLSALLTFDTDYVDIIGLGALTKRPAVLITGDTVSVTASNIKVSGISVGSQALDCTGVANQYFENCTAGANSFGYNEAAGTYVNCIAGDSSFGYAISASGTFINCEAGMASFGFESTGYFENCKCTGIWGFGGGGGGSIASGTYLNCESAEQSFGALATASGTFKNCIATGTDSFGSSGNASGYFENCKGANSSFGGSGSGNPVGYTSGTFVNCTGDLNSFGDGNAGEITGKLYNCRMTIGTFAPIQQRTVTIALGTPATFTLVSHGFNVGDAIRLTTTGALPTGVEAYKTYYVATAGLTADEFTLVEYPETAGVPPTIDASGTQSGTHSISTGRVINCIDGYNEVITK